MSLILGQLQKNIFLITLITSVLLGISLAYLSSVVLNYFFTNQSASATARSARRSAATAMAGPVFRALSEFESIVPGNFIRGANISSEPGEAGGGEISVMGTIGGDPSFARAAIQISGESTIKEFRVGQEVAGHKILAIRSNSIVVERSGSELRIPVGGTSEEAPKQQQDAATPVSSGDTVKVIKRDKFLALANNPAALYQAKFAPVTKDSKIVGVKLLYIPNDNFLFEMGARTGDILRRINGQQLENPEKLYQMWASIKSASEFKVELERSGKIEGYTIKIQ